MDNLAHGMKYPVIIDLKMGRITYDPDTPIEDVSRQMLTYPAREKVGFQLEGMRVKLYLYLLRFYEHTFNIESLKKVFNRKDLSFTRFDRTFGRSLSKDQVAHALGLFYQFHELKPQTWAIKQTLEQLEAIRHWFMKQTTYHFYKSSLIIIYDANATADNQVKVFMADFDHVFPANDTINENYLYGIERLIEYLKLLLDSTYKFKDIR
jgi:1D-myo-inositol-tetrakisphosphate 5-kinase/inositol-polyphosphate multikinase